MTTFLHLGRAFAVAGNVAASTDRHLGAKWHTPCNLAQRSHKLCTAGQR
jgi:hypothetical protein